MQLLDSEIYLFVIDHNDDVYDWCVLHKHVLSLAEHKQVSEYKFEKERVSYIISHVLLRYFISNFIEISPEKIIFSRNPFGKPQIERKNFCFNLSHAIRKTIIGFFKKDIGVDIEYINKELDIDKLSQLALTINEITLLNQLTIEKKNVRFFELWTRKEALLKAIGTGLDDCLNKIDVSDLECFNNSISTIDLKKWRITPLNIQDDEYAVNIAYNSHEVMHLNCNLINSANSIGSFFY